MKDQDFIQDKPLRRRTVHLSTGARAAAAGAASAATMAVLAFVMVVLPPLQGEAARVALSGALSVGSIV